MQHILIKDKVSVKERIESYFKVVSKEFDNFEGYKETFYDMVDLYDVFFLEDKDQKGFFFGVIAEDPRVGKILCEFLFYIKPEFRGSISLMSSLIKETEEFAKKEGCNCIEFGGNSGYKEDKFFKILCKIFGYTPYSARKVL